MNDEQMLQEVGSWLNDGDPVPPDAHQSVRQAMARTPKVRQRGRWWPLPILGRTADPSTTDQTTTFQSAPIPATNGHSPTTTGRTLSMFSPAKAITAGALVFVIGGALLIAQPFGQSGGVVPGATTDIESESPVWVTGTIGLASGCSGRTSTSEAGVRQERDYVCNSQTWTTTDPRLGGDATAMWNADLYDADGATVSVRAGRYDVRNESGGWLCRFSDGLFHGGGPYAKADNDEILTCAGHGDYEGLTAILALDWSASPPSDVPLAGLIFPGEVPPLPDSSASE